MSTRGTPETGNRGSDRHEASAGLDQAAPTRERAGAHAVSLTPAANSLPSLPRQRHGSRPQPGLNAAGLDALEADLRASVPEHPA